MLDEADTLADDDVDTDEIEAPEAEATPEIDAPVAEDQPGSADTATQTGAEQATPEAGEAEPKQDWEKRYKDLQRDHTRKSQELAALKKGGAAPAPAAEAIESDFSDEKFEEIAEKEGRGKALRYMHDCSVRAALKANEQLQEKQKAEEQQTQEVMGILSEFGDTPELRQTLTQLGQREAEQGRIPGPGAIYALAEAGGDYREAIRLIRAGKKALAGEEVTGEPAPKTTPKAPSIPGGSARRSPDSAAAARPSGKLSLSSLGIR
jgi:hypothetical protein